MTPIFLRKITLKGGPLDGDTMHVRPEQVTVLLYTNMAQASKYQDTNPDDPDPAVQHTYSAKTGEYDGWKIV